MVTQGDDFSFECKMRNYYLYAIQMELTFYGHLFWNKYDYHLIPMYQKISQNIDCVHVWTIHVNFYKQQKVKG